MTIECDILVVGGGFAGIGASLAAARLGASTVLVESREGLGGTAAVALHASLCGFFGSGPSRPDRPLNDGISTELVERLSKRSRSCRAEAVGPVWVLPVAPPDLARVVDEMVASERHLAVMTKARVAGLTMSDGLVDRAGLRTAAGEASVQAGSVIDCTGCGAVLAMAGVTLDAAAPTARQFAGFVMHIVGLEPPSDVLPIRVPYTLRRAVDRGLLPRHLRFTLFAAGIPPGEGYIKLPVKPPVDAERSATARQEAQLVYQHLRRELPAFRHASVAAMSPEAVEREGARM